MHWNPMSVKPSKSGTYLVFAPSADPERPLRHIMMYFADEDKWEGLVPIWRDALTHWAEFPPDPKPGT